jgi:pilus assembly protein CpaE
MKMDRKRLMDFPIPPTGGNALRVLLIGRTEADCVELQAALAPLQDFVVETLMTIARLPGALQKAAAPPDIVLIDVDPDSSEDLVLLRDLRKVAGIERTPVVAVISRLTDHAALRVMRAGADDVLLKPIDTKEAREVFARVMEHARASRPDSAALGKAVVFMHLSGGAGATTLAVNAACALARAPESKQVALLDLDIQFGNAASLLDLPSASPVQDFIDDPVRLDEQMLEGMMLPHATGLHVLTAPRVLLPFTAYGPEGIRAMLDLAKRRYGYTVLDLPVALAPWTDTVLRSASVIYLVVGLSVPSAHRVMKFLDLLREENIGDLPLKLVANRYQGGNKKGSDISVAQFERATGKKVDFLIPNDYSLISMSHGQGKPAVRLEPNSPFTSALREMLAADLGKDMFGKARRGFFSFKRA